MTTAPSATAARIVDAAHEVLQKSGPGKLTLDQVASIAGVHRATIFRHFPGGRNELVLAVYAQMAERYLNRLVAHVSSERTLAEAMVEGLVLSAEETFKNPTIAPLFASESGGGITALGPSSQVLNSLVRRAWGPLLDDAKNRDEVRHDLSLDTFTEFMLRMVFSLLSDWATSTRSRAETKNFLRQVITPFVTGTPAAPTPSPLPFLSRPRDVLDDNRVEQTSAENRPVADRLLENAAALFREKGFDRSSTRDLAERLGISQPSLYHHVSSKQELLERVCIESIDRMSHEIQDRALIAASPLRELISVHLSTLVRDREMHLSRVLDQDALDDDAYARVTARYAAYAGLISAIIEAEQSAGRVRTDLEPGQMAISLLNLLNWSVFWLAQGDEKSAEDAAELFTAVFLDGVADRPTRAKPPARATAGSSNGKRPRSSVRRA